MDQDILLNTLLHEMKDGVVVCDLHARIVLFNRAAETLFDQNSSLHPGSSIYDYCLQPPVEHALNLLQYQQSEYPDQELTAPFIQFMNTTARQDKFFRCRISFLHSKKAAKNSFVIIFEDVTSWYEPDSLLFMKIEQFRAPMTNLRAAVESLTEHPEMSPVMRSAFENVLVQESLNLTVTFESLARSCNVLMQTRSHLTDIDTRLLSGYLANHMRSKEIAFIPWAGHSANVKIDSFGFLQALDFLADKILLDKNKSGLACTTSISGQFFYFDFIWSGKIMPTTEVESILEEKVAGSIGNLTVSGILHSMEGDLWSQAQDDMQSILRIALPRTTKETNE